MGFEAVDQQLSLPAVERSVLARWSERELFRRSVERRAGAPVFSLFEGPPTANGPPGIHHVPNRSLKDTISRHRAMKGWRVVRQQGWDCHGIPVEVGVERELGFTGKGDIETFGVAAFNEQCRASVQRYVSDWVRLSRRIGSWVDFDRAYWTMAPDYIDSVWWSLKQLWERGLIYADHKVVPYCPRCGTALSEHEVAQGYGTAADPSIYVRFPLLDGPLAGEGAALLAWTTTPWTLTANVALAVGEDVPYALVETRDHGRLVLAAERVGTVLGEGARVLREVGAGELRGRRYRPPFDLELADTSSGDGDAAARDRYRVVTGAFVSAAEGTGVVHVAPAFGADDMALAAAEGLAVVNPVDAEGRFGPEVEAWAGRDVRDADGEIVAAVRDRGLLVRADTVERTVTFCWRCQTRLLQYARPSLYIATTRIRERMLAVNAGVDWRPEHLRDGRMGNWLEGNVDWALSRERYWGTPMPLWRCEDCGDETFVGSRAELGDLAGRDLSDLDPHRPYVDEVTLACRGCGGVARRVAEVVDVWYDSGAAPFAQVGYPYLDGSAERFAERFPATLVAEGMDQTRGWFYSLLAVSTLVFDRTGYDTAMCFGLVVDADGKKMAKSRGNAIDPWDMVERHGADALRWLALTGQSPSVEQRVGDAPVAEAVRRFVLTLWNTYAFFVTYARIDGWLPATGAPAPADRPVMDRWLLAELAATVTAVDGALEALDPTTAARRVERFVDDLSNWYVRVGRGRFWAAGDTPDKRAAYATLYAALVGVTRLVAPMTPFLADELYENLIRRVDEHAPDSVHLTDYPTATAGDDDPALRSAMAAARRVVELGRRARNDAGLVLRQPLRTARVTLPADVRGAWIGVAPVVAAELNVKRLELADSTGAVLTRRLKPNFRALGPSFGSRTGQVAAAVEHADADAVAAALADAGEVTVAVDGEAVRLTAEHVHVVEEPRHGWQAAVDGPYAVALDVTLDDALRAERLARDLARAVNEIRRADGLAVDERITLTVEADAAVAAALDAHEAWVAAETLATEVRRAAVDAGREVELAGGARSRLRVRRVGADVE